MFDFLKQANKATWGAFFYAGSVFVIAAVTGIFSFEREITPVNQQLVIPLFLLGTALLAFTAFREREENKPPPPETGPGLDVKAIGISIEQPDQGKKLPSPIIIKGKVKKPLPKGTELWLINLGRQTGRDAFWPQERVAVQPDKSWTVSYTPANYADGDVRRLQLFLTGKDAQALIEFYRHTNSYFAINGKWQGFMSRTADLQEACPLLTIQLAKQE
jgi:hypothetical protein